MRLSILLLLLGTLFQYSLAQIGFQTFPADAIPPDAVTNYSSNRTIRFHHNSFHNVRMNWALLDEIEQNQISDLGWEPVFKSFAYLDNDINQPVTLYSPGGEDFLFMHRNMINTVNQISTNANSTWQVVGWDSCPNLTDTVWPVPAVPDVGDPGYAAYLLSYKTDDFYNNVILPAEAEMTNLTYLATLTLGELGIKLEYELHTYFHVRFSAYNPIGYRPQSVHPFAFINESWDDPAYNYLADFYSSHVNPTFWKIHGWVEKRISDWETATGVTINITTWTSIWQGGPMDSEIVQALYKVSSDAEERALNPGSGNDHKKYIIAIICSGIGGAIIASACFTIGYLLLKKFRKPKSGNVKAVRIEQSEINALNGAQRTEVLDRV